RESGEAENNLSGKAKGRGVKVGPSWTGITAWLKTCSVFQAFCPLQLAFPGRQSCRMHRPLLAPIFKKSLFSLDYLRYFI
ncbi:MAG TPA: hypothetical protein VGE29_17890, partial [Prosthecobacter sp.]